MELVTIQPVDIINIDVGGKIFRTRKQTIERHEDCILAKMLKPEFDQRRSPSEAIFLDRDPQYFGLVLNWMRDETTLKITDDNVEQISREADYLNLEELISKCKVHRIASKIADVLIKNIMDKDKE